jgi:hypothetical protein
MTMLKKLLKYLKVIPIDVIIYSMTKDTIEEFPKLDYIIQSESIHKNKTMFYIKVGDTVIHQSFLFKKVFLLRLINKIGPTIGDCVTISAYKGKSIYPFVINYIAREELLKNNQDEVFIVVNADNLSSIKGIEKAGFQLHTKLKAKRFLILHYNVRKNN